MISQINVFVMEPLEENYKTRSPTRYENGRVNARKEETTGRHIEKIKERRSRGEDKGDKEESGWKKGGQRIGQFSLKISRRRGARRKRERESGRGEVVAREKDCRKAEKERDDVG